MKPSLPLRCFDLCLIPEHDAPPAHAPNVLPTLGLLNDCEPGAHASDLGLVALGGPSRHLRWDDAAMLAQLDALLEARPPRRWLVTTSRRTPDALVRRLAARAGVELVPFGGADRDWLKRCMADAAEVWTSEDSLSMIYEALSAGAPLGLLHVPRRGANRFTRAIDGLVARGWAGRPGEWTPGPGPERPLDEAARCADWIRHRWLNAH
jgi:uncharacterized protein